MSTVRDPEEILRTWLEEGPQTLPDQTARAIDVSIRSTSQRRPAIRLPWRFPTMSSYPKVAIGVAAVVAVALGGALILGPRLSTPNRGVGGDPTPSPSPTASPLASPSPTPIDPTTWTPYTSPRYGYSASRPSDWSYGASTTFWTVPEPKGNLVPMIDYVYGGYGGVDATWAATSMKVPEGMSDQAWTDLYRNGQIDRIDAHRLLPSARDMGSGDHNGVPGRLKEGCSVLEAIVFSEGRVYVFGGWVSTITTPGVPDDFRETYEAWLSTITLDPASALDPPVASPSPSCTHGQRSSGTPPGLAPSSEASVAHQRGRPFLNGPVDGSVVGCR